MTLQLAHHAACTTSRANSAAPSVSSSFIGLCTCSADASGTSEGPCIHVRTIRAGRRSAPRPYGVVELRQLLYVAPMVRSARDAPDTPDPVFWLNAAPMCLLTGRPCRTTYPYYTWGFRPGSCVTDMWDLSQGPRGGLLWRLVR